VIFLDIVLSIVFTFLSLALLLAIYRFLKGPDIADRVVALDLIAMILAAFVVAYAIFVNEPLYIDVVVVMALITFFGTVAFARYLEKGEIK
jgi:multicomponent Na+:H+ antiporter subunit F